MEEKALEAIVGPRRGRSVPYHALMPHRVRSILLVSSLYDSFIFEEDGNLTEMLFSEYLELNLRYAPRIERVSTAAEAIERIRKAPPDLVISMLRVGEMDAIEFGRQAASIKPDLPVVLLAYDTRELRLLEEKMPLEGIERVFAWQGDVRLFLAIIKYIEDRMNAKHDAETAGVRVIILIEDSVRFYSSYLPLLYTEIVEQTQALMAEGVNRMQKIFRMRARPKILLATSFEEGDRLYREYANNLLGVILDARFPRAGKVEARAGFEFARMLKEEGVDCPILIQSSEPENRRRAEAIGAAFIDKRSPQLLHEVRRFLRSYLGFGDFVFKRPDGTVVRRASDMKELLEALEVIPDESLMYHVQRNDFSTWLMARTEFELAKMLRPRRAGEFSGPAELREYLLSSLARHRARSRAGVVAQFSSRDFDPSSRFVRIGEGSLGGKGRGLAFMNSLLEAYEIERRIEGVRIFVPPTAVLGTDVFDRFMEGTNLLDLALSEVPDERLREAFLAERLPEDTRAELRAFLERVKHPLAVRSSSLLEDASHQPFAGIYQTYLLPNNHPDLTVRLEELCRAIRLVYASTYCADARRYIESTPNRLEEEKMAVVIQQMVGRRHDEFLYPDVAGVARSFDFYPMKGMDPEDGVASVALGLGRTVVEGGRCVRFSPAHPKRLYQFPSTQAYLENSQREFFALDLSKPGVGDSGLPDENLAVLGIKEAIEHGTIEPVGSVYSPENDTVYEGTARDGVKLITMAGVLSGEWFPLAETLRFLLEVLTTALSCHVEIEFAVNISERGRGEFGFLQVRPLVKLVGEMDEAHLDVPPAEAVCISESALGHGRIEGVRDIVYVKPDDFDRSATPDVAREIGQLDAKLRSLGRRYVLIGPGRWGSADRWLGIPVTWAQISGVACMVETEMKDVAVDPSQGTHFFQNITSFGIGYLTVESSAGRGLVDYAWLDAQPAADETRYLRHVQFEQPLEIVIDGRRRRGVIRKPGA